MGYALAQAGIEGGHAVRLVSGPTALTVPDGVAYIPVESAHDMLQAVLEHVGWCDALVMAAAVADWRPRDVHPAKLKKADGLDLVLERTDDILEQVRTLKGSRCFVGFAAETGDPEAEARRKLAAKGLDLIVANDVSRPDSGFAADTNRVLLLAADGAVEALPLMSKLDVAREILKRIPATAE